MQRESSTGSRSGRWIFAMMGQPIGAVILAAGRGKRLGVLTRQLPKCLAVTLKGKTLLQTQVDVFRACGIRKISVVRGYQGEKICFPDLHYFTNDRYDHTDMLESLFCAKSALVGGTVISYSDIWYEAPVLTELLRCQHDIVIGVDADWRKSYVDRQLHTVEEAEAVVMNARQDVVRIGKIAISEDAIAGEFIGLMKLTERGCELLRDHYQRARVCYAGKPFQRAKQFRKAYLTDLLQEMADQGVSIRCQVIHGRWKEIDTPEDLLRARQFVEHQSVEHRAPPRRD